MTTSKIPFNAELIESFAGVFLSPLYDNPAPTAPFHRECWELYASEAPLIAIAAPRGHAKSTALTHNYGLAAALFRQESHILVLSATEELAMGQLTDIAKELRDNEDLRAEFGISHFTTDAKGEIIVACNDKYEFRFVARGAGQKLRGMKWHGRRPGLILCDDMEEDEQVASPDRRNKFRRWVLRALLPMGRRGCKVRWHGTIMHDDALLARLMSDTEWISRRFKAHKSFNEFTNILWPEAFDEKRLRSERQKYINQHDAGGYSQEYLNDPLDNEDAYLKKDWFLPMRPDDYDSTKITCAAADWAISKADSANRTSFTAAGKDSGNVLNYTGQAVGRWDSEEIVEQLFDFEARWRPDVFWVETGQIWLALWPLIKKEMLKRDRFINFVTRVPIKDKQARGRAFQKRMRSGACRFDKQAEWYEAYEEELLRFTETGEATLDDQFDSSALLALGFEDMGEVEAEDVMDEEELDMIERDPRKLVGRSHVTGY